MADKLQTAREYILYRIENGIFKGGEKLPAARELAEAAGIAFTIIQMAFNTLVSDGILYSVPRQGTYVRKDWKKRILPGSLRAFRPIWHELFDDFISGQVPGFRASEAFEYGAFEIRPTGEAADLQHDYLDLSEFLDEVYPERSDFFNARIEEFRGRNGELYGLPLMFSPWVFCCDREKIEAAGCKVPHNDWTWSEFMELVQALCRKYPPGMVVADPFDRWVDYLAHCSGESLVRSGDIYEVGLDSPRSIAALTMMKELSRLLAVPPQENKVCERYILELCTRQDFVWMSLDGVCVPMPRVPGVDGRSRMAGDLFCVRKAVNDFDAVRRMIRVLLSTELQTELAGRRYGIPIRKSCAIASFDDRDPRDIVFFSEMPKITPLPYHVWPICRAILHNAMKEFRDAERSAEDFVGELTPVLRAVIKYTDPQ